MACPQPFPLYRACLHEIIVDGGQRRDLRKAGGVSTFLIFLCAHRLKNAFWHACSFFGSSRVRTDDRNAFERTVANPPWASLAPSGPCGHLRGDLLGLLTNCLGIAMVGMSLQWCPASCHCPPCISPFFHCKGSLYS